jgi:uncharacterized protein YrrD
MNFFGLLTEIYSKNPGTIWNSTFGNGVNVGQLYQNPEGGYYEIIKLTRIKNKDGKLLKDIRDIVFYEDVGKDKMENTLGLINQHVHQ